MLKEIADIKTADQLNLPTPEVECHNIVSEPTEFQQAMVKELSKRAEKVHGGIDPHIDNMLRITSDGRKLGLDQRIINPMLPDEPETKVNKCVANILKIWKEGDSERLTQLVFCDIATPSGKPAGGSEDATFTNIYDDIRKKLISGGMAPEQVAFIHSAKTDIHTKERAVRKSPLRTGACLNWFYSEDGCRDQRTGQAYRITRPGLPLAPP